MKLSNIFGVVLAVHIVAIALIFIQPGCQSTPVERAQTGPSEAPSTEEPGIWSAQDADTVEPLRVDDGEPAVAARQPQRSRFSPTRPPEEERRPARDEGILRPDRDEGEAAAATTYIVQRGDSLWSVAQKHNVRVNALLTLNRKTADSVIHPGDELLIPAGGDAPRTAATPQAQDYVPYTVQRGDTLSGIAARNRTTVSALRSANGLTNDVIRVGQTLRIPSGASAPAESGQRREQSERNGKVHTVKAGETPGAIAARYGIRARDLMAANGITDPRRLSVGQELIIPGVDAEKPEQTEERPREERRTAEPEPETPTLEDLERAFPDDDDFPIIPIVPEENDRS